MKKYLLLVLFSVATLFSKAQTSDWLWAKTAAKDNNSQGYCVTTDAAGNVYVAGGFNSDSLIINNTPLANFNGGSTDDVFLIKYDALGNLLWAKSAGGSGSDDPTGLTTDASGNVYLTGYFNSPSIAFGPSTLTNVAGNNDMFIAKYNSAGDAQWAKSAGGDGNNYSNALATDVSGSVYVAGYYSSSSIDFGTGALANNSTVNGVNAFIAKYNSSGTIKWAKSVGGTTRDFGFSVASSANHIYLTGSFASSSISFGSTTLTNSAGSPTLNMFLTQYDTAGNVQWAKAYAADDNTFVNGMSADASDNVYITGFFYSSAFTLGSTTLTNNGIHNMFLAKFNNAGNAAWATTAATGPNEANVTSNAVSSDNLGNTFITGTFSTDSITLGSFTLTTSSGYDVFVAKYDASGNATLAQDGFGTANGAAVASDNFGNNYLTGQFGIGNATFGPLTLSPIGETNFFLAKYGGVASGIKPVSTLANSLCVFPNPSQGKFIVKLNGYNATRLIQVYDVVGRMVYQSTLSNLQTGNFYQLDLSNQAAGVYFVQLNEAGVKTERQKIVITR